MNQDLLIKKSYFGDCLKFYIRGEETLDKYIISECLGTMYASRIKDTLSINDVWLDAGGNIGGFSILISSHVGKIFAFEPEADNYKLFVKNLHLNRIKNVSCFQKALVSDDRKHVFFYLNCYKNKGGHSCYVKRGRRTVLVSSENVCKAISQFKINKIKMDVEGAEKDLLYSLETMLLKQIDELIFEWHHNILDSKDHRQYFNMIDYLKNCNFNKIVYKKDPKKNWHSIVYAKK